MKARSISLTACGLLFFLVAGPASAAESKDKSKDKPKDNKTAFAEHAALDAVAGGPASNRYVLTLQGGWAFSALRANVGLTSTLSLQSELESALGRRYRPMLGLGIRIVDGERFRLTGELLAGWLFQRSEENLRGPNGELRVRLALPRGRFVPYLVLGTRHAFFSDLTTIERISGETETIWAVRHEWTPWATLGLAFGLSKGFGLDLGIDYGWVGAPDTIALPGIHLGLHVGGPR